MEGNKKIMDHFRNPRNVGEIQDASGVGTIANATCGDIIQLFVKVCEGKIVDAKFKTFGCGASIAASSIITEEIKGKTPVDALEITEEIISGLSHDMPMDKMPCSLLARDALKAALYEYHCKKNKGC